MSAYTNGCTDAARTVYDHCLPNTGPSVPIVVVALLGLALLMIGIAGVLLTRAGEDRERALEAARRGHVL